MFQLQPNEKIITSVRKHWFVVLRTLIIFVILILIPPVILSILPLVAIDFNTELIGTLVNFFFSLYLLVLFLFLFLFWMDYYLDMWIITDRRIIDVEQKGLFRRAISEIPLIRVQDVTIEVHGIIETFLKFGTIKIQTAGEREFTINNIPRLYEIKDIILRHVRAQ